MVAELSRRRFVAAGAGLVFLATGCGRSRDPVDVAGIVRRFSADDPYPEAVVEAARAEGEVLLYTGLDAGITRPITALFEERFGVSVSFVQGGTAEIVSRLYQETRAGNISADVIDVSDISALTYLKDRNLLDTFDNPWGSRLVDQAYADPDRTWFASRATHGITQFEAASVDDPPPTWQALTDPALHGRIATWAAPGASEVPRLWALAENLGYDLLRDLAANDPLVTSTPATLSQTIARGERPIGFLSNDNHAFKSRRDGEGTDLLYPADGVPRELGAVAKVRDSAHPNAGLLFASFWLGDEAQQLLTQEGKYSARDDIAPPEGLPALSDVTAFTIDPANYLENRDEIVFEILDIFGRG